MYLRRRHDFIPRALAKTIPPPWLPSTEISHTFLSRAAELLTGGRHTQSSVSTRPKASVSAQKPPTPLRPAHEQASDSTAPPPAGESPITNTVVVIPPRKPLCSSPCFIITLRRPRVRPPHKKTPRQPSPVPPAPASRPVTVEKGGWRMRRAEKGRWLRELPSSSKSRALSPNGVSPAPEQKEMLCPGGY